MCFRVSELGKWVFELVNFYGGTLKMGLKIGAFVPVRKYNRGSCLCSSREFVPKSLQLWKYERSDYH